MVEPGQMSREEASGTLAHGHALWNVLGGRSERIVCGCLAKLTLECDDVPFYA